MSNTSTEAILKFLSSKMNELSRVQGHPDVQGRWAQAFLENCLGFNAQRDYQVSYSNIGINWRPTLIISREGQTFCTLEVGPPSMKKHKDIPFGFLFTGQEWRLYDLHAPDGVTVMAICDFRAFINREFNQNMIIELEKELAPFHETAYQSKMWDDLMLESRKCNSESVTNVLMSTDVLGLMQERLGITTQEPSSSKLLQYKLSEMLEGKIKPPVKPKNGTYDPSAA